MANARTSKTARLLTTADGPARDRGQRSLRKTIGSAVWWWSAPVLSSYCTTQSSKSSSSQAPPRPTRGRKGPRVELVVSGDPSQNTVLADAVEMLGKDKLLGPAFLRISMKKSPAITPRSLLSLRGHTHSRRDRVVPPCSPLPVGSAPKFRPNVSSSWGPS